MPLSPTEKEIMEQPTADLAVTTIIPMTRSDQGVATLVQPIEWFGFRDGYEEATWQSIQENALDILRKRGEEYHGEDLLPKGHWHLVMDEVDPDGALRCSLYPGRGAPPPQPDREELIQLCADGVRPQDKWFDRDSAGAQIQMAVAGLLLKAGCDYEWEEKQSHGSHWVRITWRGFQAVELGSSYYDHDLFYIPSRDQLDAAGDGDWYGVRT